MTEQEQQIIKVIDDYHEKTGGKCGISAIQIAQHLNTTFLEIRDALNDLNDNNAFTVREGINNILIFKKWSHNTP